MAKVSFDRTEYRAISGDGITVDILFRRLTDLEQTECAEVVQAESRRVDTEEYFDEQGRKLTRRTMTVIPDDGRYVRGVRRAMELAIRGWRDVTDEKGAIIPFSMENVEVLTANYPAWGESLMQAVNEYCRLTAKGNETPANPQTPTDEQPGSSSGSAT